MLNKKIALLVLPLAATLSLSAANPFDDPFFNDPFGDDIFKEMIQMQKEMDQMFQRMQERRSQRSSRLVSPLGTYKMVANQQLEDKGAYYEMLTNIPQSEENHINITTDNGMMSVTAKIVQNHEKNTNGMVSKSSSMRMYQQAVPLPSDADTSAIKTSYAKGKLLITMDKKKGAVTANTVQINGKTQAIQKNDSIAKEVKAKEVKTDKKTAAKSVPITHEFDQTPKTPEKVTKSEAKESNSTINKTLINNDKSSMI